MKRTFDFGKIRYTNKRNRVNRVTVEMELRQQGGETTFTVDCKTGEKTITGTTPVYYELSICGSIWNASETDIVCGGQCLDEIARYKSQLNNPALFAVLYDLWKNYHLNGMNAGTPEQEKAVEEWKAAGNRYDYTAACEMLKSRGLYTVNYTGLAVGRRYENEPYTYGHGWIVQELPESVLNTIQSL